MNDNTLHIAFCVNDAYVKYICVTIKSILDNNKHCNLCINVVIDEITKKAENTLNELFIDQKNAKLRIHIIDDSKLQGIELGRWTISAWYRILLPEILSDVDKVLYLDADTLVVGDLLPLFELPINNISLIAPLDSIKAPDDRKERIGISPTENYICSGVLLLNLAYWREHRLTQKIINWAHDHQQILIWPDQDSINAICHDSLFVTHPKYGVTEWLLLSDDFYIAKQKKILEESIDTPIIIHYNGVKPWYFECKHPFRGLWYKYNTTLKNKNKLIYKTDGFLLLKQKTLHIFFNKRYLQKQIFELKERINRI